MAGYGLERYMNAVAAHVEDGDRPSTGFAARHVGDVMTREVWSAHPVTPFKEIARVLDRERVHGVPVIDDSNHVLGVVTASDLLARTAGADHALPRGHRMSAHRANAAKRHGLTAEELMTAPAVTVTPSATIAEAARVAAHSRVRTLPVVNTDGEIVGIVTRDDLIRVYLRLDDDIRRDVERDVVKELPRVPENDVTVEVVDGVVTVRGSVTTALTAAHVVYEAKRVPGVVDVRDELDWVLDDVYQPTQ